MTFHHQVLALKYEGKSEALPTVLAYKSLNI